MSHVEKRSLADLQNPGEAESSSENVSREKPRYPTTREEWKNFPVEIAKYRDGRIQGDRLLIGGWSVMEEWERPVQNHTVQLLFSHVQVGYPIALIRGEGLGYATQETINQLRIRGGGELNIIELHPDIIEQGRQRVNRQLRGISRQQRENITVNFLPGDAPIVTEQFPNDYFDVILSDTFPLSQDEKDINDIKDTDEIVRVLKPSGVFSPFIGHQDGPTDQQMRHMGGRFNNYDVSIVSVKPPQDCPYYQADRMAIMVCRTPIKPVFGK